MIRTIVLVAACASLAGCAMPTSLRIASWAADGLVYLATDKSVADHGLSALSGQDCKMLRVASARSVCEPVGGNVDFNGDLDGSRAGLVAEVAECRSAVMAESLTSGKGLDRCASTLVERFGAEGALAYADARIAAMIDAGRTDDAGLWYGVQATMRATPGAPDRG